MAPVRKSRSVNKRFVYTTEASPVKDVKDGDSGSKSNKRKRKVSDMLGPQWSKEDLQRFYEAYRKYGKDWRKVAVAVRNRTMEMVEALYTMNRAYLSLPEGTASVVGLIAMMTDHYSVLEGSDSEQESNDGVAISRKPLKRPRGKLPANTRGLDRHLSDPSRPQPVASANGCLSLLKKRRPEGNQPRAVGKRTPRIPVRYTQDNVERYISPSRHGLKSKLDAEDDEVAHEVALALAEASHRGGSPQGSQTPSKRKQTATASPAGMGERMCSESEMTSAKNVGKEMGDDGCEGSLGSTEGNTGFRTKKPIFAARKGISTLDQPKAKKSYGKKQAVEDVGNNDADEIKEACSGTEEGQRFSSFERKLGAQSRDVAFLRQPGQSSKKRSKKVLFGGDEGVALDALQALADLSLMMPASTLEAESTTPLKEEKESDIAQSRRQELLPAKGKFKASPSKKKVDQSAVNVLISESKTLKSGRVSAPGSSPIAETKDPNNRRRKQKPSLPKTSGAEVQIDADTSAKQSKEVSNTGAVPISKSRQSAQNTAQQCHGQLVRVSEHSSSSADIRKDGDESAVSSMLAVPTVMINSPTKSRSRRKMNNSQIERNSGDLQNQEAFVNDTFGWSNINKAVVFKERLSHCISNYRVRRWCACEWFYSSIDYPWFAKSEFVEYLYHVGLGHVPRLTRVEWGVIRSSLGKPRRFSEQFLKEEKEKLTHYRESVRKHYTELRMGKRAGLPADLARPLTVGQRVISIHPRSREVHNGSILTVDHNRCRVQFDRPDIGVEFVKDIDCMPLNPLENMPTSLRRHQVPVDKVYEALKQFKTNEGSQERKEEIIKFNASQKVDNADGAACITPAFFANKFPKQEGISCPSLHDKVSQSEVVSHQPALTYQQSTLSQMQAKEADIHALAELTRALDKKNALITELKRMNDDVSEDSSLKDIDSFKKQYAAVLVQLNEVLEQVSSALMCLRQRNTYHGNYALAWQKPMANLEDRSQLASSFSCLPSESHETGPHINEIVETSRIKARNMVDAVLQVVSSIKEGANFDRKMDDAVNHVNKSSTPVQTIQLNGSSAHQNQRKSFTSSVSAPDHVPDSYSNGVTVEGETPVPSDLITNCVATLLMIQKCTERQFPPAEVAKILDFAVTNLQPRCTQNLPVYSEIQKCMGIIRSQILALIPTYSV